MIALRAYIPEPPPMRAISSNSLAAELGQAYSDVEESAPTFVRELDNRSLDREGISLFQGVDML